MKILDIRLIILNLPFTEAIEIGCKAVGMTLERGYKYLFDLLGMDSSSINYRPNKYKGYVDTRVLGPDDAPTWLEAFKYNVEQQVSGGGIYSTADDITKFIRFHLNQLKLPDDKKLIDPIYYDGVYVDGKITISVPIDITYIPVCKGPLSKDPISERSVSERFLNEGSVTEGCLNKIFAYSGALENVRTSFKFSPNTDIGIFVAVNGSPNVVPEALIYGFLEVLNGGSIEDAEKVYNEQTKILAPQLIGEFCPLSTTVNGTPISNTTEIAGTYRSNIYMDVEIKDNGTIKVGKLKPVQIYRVRDKYYEFLLYNKEDLPFVGNFIVLSPGAIKLTYYCDTDVYHMI